MGHLKETYIRNNGQVTSRKKVIERGDAKLLWGFSIQTDREIQAPRPDIVLIDRKKDQCMIIAIAVPGDDRVAEKEKDKIEKYQDLRRELGRLWNIRAIVVGLW